MYTRTRNEMKGTCGSFIIFRKKKETILPLESQSSIPFQEIGIFYLTSKRKGLPLSTVINDQRQKTTLPLQSLFLSFRVTKYTEKDWHMEKEGLHGTWIEWQKLLGVVWIKA